MPPDVMGATEAARHIGVGVKRLYVLAKRDDFPKPTPLACGWVWDGAAIRAWKLDRYDPRAHSNRTRGIMLMSYRKTGVVNRAARTAGVDPSTARKWLRDLGVALPSEREAV